MLSSTKRIDGFIHRERTEGEPLEELYPGRSGDGFQVTGHASVSQSPTPIFFEGGRTLFTGLRSFGRKNLFVQQYGQDSSPSFDFRPLTGASLYDFIGSEPSFAFSITSPYIGDVTYVSGIDAREYGGEVKQGMVSLQASGHWDQRGLTLNMGGGLGEKSAGPHMVSIEPEFRHASYAVTLNIPWQILRFVFYNEMGLITENYRKYGKEA